LVIDLNTVEGGDHRHAFVRAPTRLSKSERHDMPMTATASHPAIETRESWVRPQDIRRDSPTAATWPLAARAMPVIVEFNAKIPRFSDALDD